MWIELSYVEIEILASLALQPLTIELTKIDLNHYDSIEIDDLHLHENLMDLLEVSLDNWFFECYFYEIEIYSWSWVHDFENLINDFNEKRGDLD